MDNDVINLRDQVAVLRRRWRVVAICLLLGLGLGVTMAQLQERMYAATAEVLVAPVATAGMEARAGELLAPEEISTQVEVIRSRAVALRAMDDLDLETDVDGLLSSVSVQQQESTRELHITALRGTPGEAADVANAFANAYLFEREAQASGQASAAVQSLQERYDAAADQLADIQAELASADESELAVLESQQQAVTVQLTQLLSQLADANTVAETDQSGGEVTVPASAPSSPAQPDLIRQSMLGLVLGLLLGVGLAFVRDHFDDGIRDESRLRAVLHQRPVLGRIPHWNGARSGRLVTIAEPHASAGEAFRSLSSSVRFLLAASRRGEDDPDGGHRTLLVTSAAEGEGKTTVAGNLAVAAARFGLRVILVDADLRNPAVAQAFGLGRPPGLSNLLADGGDLDSYLLDVNVRGLKLLAGGSVPPNPAELLASGASDDLMRRLRARADLVILDSAPVTRVADTREMMPSVDLVLLVVRYAVTGTRALADSLERIRQVGGQVSGAVFNDVETRGGRDINYYVHGLGGRDRKRQSGPETEASKTQRRPAPGVARQALDKR